jgi:hypothetical protein
MSKLEVTTKLKTVRNRTNRCLAGCWGKGAVACLDTSNPTGPRKAVNCACVHGQGAPDRALRVAKPEVRGKHGARGRTPVGGVSRPRKSRKESYQAFQTRYNAWLARFGRPIRGL